jgi:2-polyprenyl-3-methyl-5-hydroxy-6-metoxy-1,4-benzoquinol methylase
MPYECSAVNICKVCGNADENKIHLARELMLGYGGYFEYLECSACGCVQIKDIPQDLSKYYPQDYYSFGQQQFTWLSAYLRNQRTEYKLYGTNLIGMLMSKLAGDYSRLSHRKGWFSKAGLSRHSSILDVGCGSGKLLRRLGDLGFTNLTGLDPFIEQEIHVGSLVIYKKEISDLEGLFDFVMLHHSFEHMPKPLETLKGIRRILRPGSYALIRIPVASYAWQTYGVNWVQLDAPRHLYLHTVKSMNLMANQAGFEIADIVFDSTSYQFASSEGNIRQQEHRSDDRNGQKSSAGPLSRKRLREYRRKSIELNSEGAGDQACFYLRNA